MTKKIYINPINKTNEYTYNFCSSFKNSSDWEVINRFGNLGLLNLVFNIDASVFVFHWVETIPYRKLGILQFLMYIMMLTFLRVTSKEVIIVLHNKMAHTGRTYLSLFSMRISAKLSNIVITHSLEGVDFFNHQYPKYKGKCYYIPHPVYRTDTIMTDSPVEWDYIVWGGVEKRKNILEFINFSKKDSVLSKKKILICGKCKDEKYDQQIREAITSNMLYINKYLPHEELEKYICKSKNILFTYSEDSVLSSGALIYSLNFYKPIIGPRVGSFRDLEGIVTCYDKFRDIPFLIDLQPNKEMTSDYIKNNTWQNFVNKFNKVIQHG